MNIGVPKEIKDQEFRVGLSPASVKELCDRQHTVVVETQAGAGAGFSDDDYLQAGAKIARCRVGLAARDGSKGERAASR